MQYGMWQLVGFCFLGVAVLILFVLWRAFFRWRDPDCTVRTEAKKIGVVVGVLTTVVAGLSLATLLYDEMELRKEDAGRFATRTERTIHLHPSGITFQVPQDWLEWDSQFHDNFHLTHRELQKVRVGAGEWDSEYASVVNAALPFEHCAAHVGGEGWGLEGASFGDLQVRAYVTDFSRRTILERIETRSFSKAKSIAESEGGWIGNKAHISISPAKDWQRATIEYPLWYLDYGGTAVVDFYLRDAPPYQFVLVFIGGAREDEKSSILDSVSIVMNTRP